MRLALVLLFLLFPGPGDGSKDGRKGNVLYRSEQYREAADAYRAALASADALPPDVQYALANNLGAALHRDGDLQAAGQAFARAVELAPSDADVARSAYNAGNNAFAQQQLESALEQYRRALLADPSNEDARFNYEFAKRRLEQQQQQQQQQQQGGGNDQEQNPQDQQNQQGQQDPQDPGDQPQQGDDEQEGSDQQQQARPDPSDEGQRQDQPRAPQPDPNELSREQAEQILQALQHDEEQLLRQVQKPKTRPRNVEKDW